MNYSDTLGYLYSRLPMYQRKGAAAYKPGLDNTIALCRILQDPQDKFRSVHIAGTNGKGSVSHILASILMETGLRTGLYTSPHLKDYRERIRINGKMVPKGWVTEFVRKYRIPFESVSPSFFEFTAVMAFRYFEEEQVDIAVIETGMGGRLDSTNVITPILSVITNISYDHMQFLGGTLPLIAGEKAGIIKPGIPVVIGETQEETAPVFRAKAAETGSPLLFADQVYSASNLVLSGPGNSHLQADIRKHGSPYLSRLNSPLAGLYQGKNLVTVCATVDMLRDSGYEIRDAAIYNGVKRVIRNTGLMGRWQVIARTPLTICDTGHNEAGIREVLQQIARVPHEELHFVFGTVNDKDLSTILSLLPKEGRYYFCRPDIPRGLDVQELARQAGEVGLNGLPYASVREAITAAQASAKAGDLVFIGGSTFVVAEAITKDEERRTRDEGRRTN